MISYYPIILEKDSGIKIAVIIAATEDTKL